MPKYFFVLSLLVLAGCNYTIQKPVASDSGAQAIETLPTGTIPGYQTVNKGIIGPKCLECHSNAGGNGGGVNLETYNNVKSDLVDIRSEVTSGRMPKNRAPLTAKEKEVLLAWLDAGGSLDGATTTPTTNKPTPTPTPEPGDVMPDPDKIDFQLVNTKVITPRCVGCHSDKGGNKGDVNLETYDNIYSQIDTIKDEVESGSMPRPKNKPLTDFQKKLFLTWIEKGAPKTVPQQ